jgi:hypothetical protein
LKKSYLPGVLSRIAFHPLTRIEELLPWDAVAQGAELRFNQREHSWRSQSVHQNVEVDTYIRLTRQHGQRRTLVSLSFHGT